MRPVCGINAGNVNINLCRRNGFLSDSPRIEIEEGNNLFFKFAFIERGILEKNPLS